MKINHAYFKKFDIDQERLCSEEIEFMLFCIQFSKVLFLPSDPFRSLLLVLESRSAAQS